MSERGRGGEGGRGGVVLIQSKTHCYRRDSCTLFVTHHLTGCYGNRCRLLSSQLFLFTAHLHSYIIIKNLAVIVSPFMWGQVKGDLY